MGSGKNRWRIFYRCPNDLKLEKKPQEPPNEFICCISGSLMADPVIVSSGQTFENNCVQVCKKLGFVPILSDKSKPDFSTVIPNIAFKSTILSWCDTHRIERPKPIEYHVAEKLVRTLMAEKKMVAQNEKIEVSEEDLLKAVADNPPVLSHAATELNRRSYFYSSSEESFITTIPTTPLPLATRPSCYSSSSSSSEIVSDETLNLTLNPEEEEIVYKMRSCHVYEQEEGVISLRRITRAREDVRFTLCSVRVLSAIRSLIVSRYSIVQVNAVAALVNLSIEKENKVKIVRSGVVPLLINVLKGGFAEAQEHAAGALFSLAVDDDNKTAIGVLGAIPPLLHMLRSELEGARRDSALALYHLSLVQSNRSKLLKLGAVPVLLSMVKAGDLASPALLILCNLAVCNEGRAAMLDVNAVECFVGMLRDGELRSEMIRENCVAVLYSLSYGSLRFRGLAKEARAGDVLVEVAEKGSERAREKARKMLEMMRGRNESEPNSEEDWESILNSGVVSRNRYRGEEGSNSSAF